MSHRFNVPLYYLKCTSISVKCIKNRTAIFSILNKKFLIQRLLEMALFPMKSSIFMNKWAILKIESSLFQIGQQCLDISKDKDSISMHNLAWKFPFLPLILQAFSSNPWWKHGVSMEVCCEHLSITLKKLLAIRQRLIFHVQKLALTILQN